MFFALRTPPSRAGSSDGISVVLNPNRANWIDPCVGKQSPGSSISSCRKALLR